MKLIIAVIQDEDAENLLSALIAENFRVTQVSTTGSLLRTGNTSLLIGVADDQVPDVFRIIGSVCHRRTQVAVPYSPALEPGLMYLAENLEVEVGGAIIFVLNVGRFERIYAHQVE
ncbi:MAG: hypothetical protein EA415_12215 [Sphaerobacteraceae bacterium]|nr:MAG: hypothetical protein EA415_12215 [Sphaerobacteraceae bacterium]